MVMNKLLGRHIPIVAVRLLLIIIAFPSSDSVRGPGGRLSP